MSWYDDLTLVSGLGSALINAEVLTDSEDYKNFLLKPMRYNSYYNAWEEAGFPTDEDDDEWNDFIEAISMEDESDET